MKTISILKSTVSLLLLISVCTATVAQMATEPSPHALQANQAARKGTVEKRFYAKMYGFYGFAAPSGFSGQLNPPLLGLFLDSESTYSNYKTTGSFGVGLRLGGGLGFVVNDFISLGLDGEYVLSQTVSESILFIGQENNRVSDNFTAYLDYRLQMLSVVPNITFKAISKPEYYIYNRLGLVVGIPMRLEYGQSSKPNIPQSEDYEISYDLERNVALGYQAALGIQFRISGQMRGFVEAVISNVRLKANTATFSKGVYKNENGETVILEAKDLRVEDLKINDLGLKMPVTPIGLGCGIVLRF